jgi:hypothetical protein
MKKLFIKLIMIVLVIGILLGFSYPQKQIISGKNEGIQETIQVHIYFWFLATFRVIDKNISDHPIYIESTPHEVVLKHDNDSIYIPDGGARNLPGIFMTLQPNEPRISRLYFKMLFHTKYDLSKQIDWGFDSKSIKPFVLRGVLEKN